MIETILRRLFPRTVDYIEYKAQGRALTTGPEYYYTKPGKPCK